MSGAALIIIATEEEEEESAALRACVQQYGDSLDRPTDVQLEVLAGKIDALKAEIVAMRLQIEGAQA